MSFSLKSTFHFLILAPFFLGFLEEAKADTLNNLSNAAKWLVGEAVKDACPSGKGEIDPQGLRVIDLDADGKDDLIIHHEWIVCGPTGTKASTCGNAACEIDLFLRRGQLLTKSTTYMGIGLEIDGQSPPTLKTQGFRFQDVYTRWTGQKFEAVGSDQFVKTSNKLTTFLEEKGCVVSENELFQFFLDISGGGIAFANTSVINFANRSDVEGLGGENHDFRFIGSEKCSPETPYLTTENFSIEHNDEFVGAYIHAPILAIVYVTRACFANPTCQKTVLEIAAAYSATIAIKDTEDEIRALLNENTSESKASTTSPGDCTPEQHRSLQNDVDTFCKTAKSCKKSDSLETLQQKTEIFRNCALARTKINKTCFRGGDRGHQQAEENAYKAQANCEIFLEGK